MTNKTNGYVLHSFLLGLCVGLILGALLKGVFN